MDDELDLTFVLTGTRRAGVDLPEAPALAWDIGWDDPVDDDDLDPGESLVDTCDWVV